MYTDISDLWCEKSMVETIEGADVEDVNYRSAQLIVHGADDVVAKSVASDVASDASDVAKSVANESVQTTKQNSQLMSQRQ